MVWFLSAFLIAFLHFDHNPIADSIVGSVLSHCNNLFDSFFEELENRVLTAYVRS